MADKDNKEKTRYPGIVEWAVLIVILVLLWHFTDFKDWLLEDGGIVKVIKEMITR